MDIKSRQGVIYLVGPGNFREMQIRTLDRLLPRFFEENTIITDSPIVAMVTPTGGIEFHPLKTNAKVEVRDEFSNPWRSSYGAKIISNEIGGSKFTVYYDNSSLCR